jgi:hypothetical protein
MWLFKRHGKESKEDLAGVECPTCRRRNTKIKVNFGNDQPDYIKTWRGQRFVIYHCLNCQKDFSISEPPQGIDIEAHIGNQTVDDEDALKAAEEDLKREMDDKGDHRFG